MPLTATITGIQINQAASKLGAGKLVKGNATVRVHVSGAVDINDDTATEFSITNVEFEDWNEIRIVAREKLQQFLRDFSNAAANL